MMRRILLATLVLPGLLVLVVMIISYGTPVRVTRGGFANLPLTHVQCEKGRWSFMHVAANPGNRAMMNNGSRLGIGWNAFPLRGTIHAEGGMTITSANTILTIRGLTIRPINLDLMQLPKPEKDVALNAWVRGLEIRGWGWVLPLAMLAWPVGSFVVGPVRRHRRRRRGLCAACGYDLTGNTSGVCPECGVSV